MEKTTDTLDSTIESKQMRVKNCGQTTADGWRYEARPVT